MYTYIYIFFIWLKKLLKYEIVYPFKRYNSVILFVKKIILLQYTTEQLHAYKNKNRGKVILINRKYCNSNMKKK